MKIMRVFPRRTKATPTDDLVRIGEGPGMFDECDAVHISVTFTWDLPLAEKLAEAWKHVAPVSMGGPAIGSRGGDFTPGMYVCPGYVITSRGCPNQCWFCSVWKREGRIVRELPITEGWNVLDDNLLACSRMHVLGVFLMLTKQKISPQFTGGLEAKRLQPWHAEALRALHPKQVFFAYDTDDDLTPLQDAGKMMLDAGFTEASHTLRCYVLCGYPKDKQSTAGIRMKEAMRAGFTPMAMFYRDEKGTVNPDWKDFQRRWARPAIIHSKVRTI